MTSRSSINHLGGAVRGPVVQAREIHGGVHVQGSVDADGHALDPPYELPPLRPYFVDRQQQIAAVQALATAAGDGVLRLVVLTGQGGVGKTALGVRGLHTARDRFPAGVLYGNLGGFSGTRVVGPHVLLNRWLRLLGVDPVPAGLDEASARLRMLTARRPVAILLDDVNDPADVRAVLPGSGLVVVTSRLHLPDLAVEAAEIINVGPLDPDAAAELVASFVGDRAGEDPRAVQELAALCGHLPLALCITGARLLARRRPQSIRDVIGELADPQRRPAALTAGEISVAKTLAASYDALPGADARRAYRLLSVCPGQDFGLGAAAATLDVEPDEAERLIELLVDAHLLEDHGVGSYRYGIDARSHARDLAERDSDDGEPGREAGHALARAVDYYLRYSAAADYTLAPLRWRISPAFNLAFVHHQLGQAPFTSAEAARVWLDVEAVNTVAAQEAAVRAGLYGLAWQFIETLREHHLTRRDYGLFQRISTNALISADHTGDPRIKARVHALVGFTYRSLGDLDNARDHITKALALSRQSGDRLALASAYEQMGLICRAEGRPDRAVDAFTEGQAIHRRCGGERRGEALITQQLGMAYLELNKPDVAMPHLKAAYEEFLALPDTYNQARALLSIGEAHLRQANPRLALQVLEEALPIMAEQKSDYNVAHILTATAEAYDQLGNRSRARELIVRTLEIYDRTGVPADHPQRRRASGLAAGSPSRDNAEGR